MARCSRALRQPPRSDDQTTNSRTLDEDDAAIALDSAVCQRMVAGRIGRHRLADRNLKAFRRRSLAYFADTPTQGSSTATSAARSTSFCLGPRLKAPAHAAAVKLPASTTRANTTISSEIKHLYPELGRWFPIIGHHGSAREVCLDDRKLVDNRPATGSQERPKRIGGGRWRFRLEKRRCRRQSWPHRALHEESRPNRWGRNVHR